MSPSVAFDKRATEHLFQYGRLAITKLYNAEVADIPKYDLAEMNLISAYGLPGTSEMNMGAMLALLGSWARGASEYTLGAVNVFYRRRSDFYGSLARFRITAMIHYLSRTCCIRYNPDRITDPDNFDDPEDSFIHGLLGSRRMGTCASLPVLLTAVGRRLGYPLKLVLAPGHCFCRWDSPEEKFNIEYHEGGLNSHPDESYKEWPRKWTPELSQHERNRPVFLQSLTPQQELAFCAHMRACQLDIAGRRNEALAAAHVAYRLWPRRGHGVWVTHLTTKALYPDQHFPHAPCEETAGFETFNRLVREKNLAVLDPLG